MSNEDFPKARLLADYNYNMNGERGLFETY